MAGHCIAFQRIVRLKDAIASTITSSEFITLKVAKDEMVLLKDPILWECLADIVRAAFPALRVFWLADKKTAGMDKLYYYVRKTDVTITTGAKKLNHIASREIQTKLRAFWQKVKDDEDEDSGASESDDSVSDDNASQDGENDNGLKSNILFETNEEGYAYDIPQDVQISRTNIEGLFRSSAVPPGLE